MDDGGVSSGGAWLHSFGSEQAPPWDQDPADAAMCQILLLPQTGRGSGTASSGGRGDAVALPGGLVLMPGLPDDDVSTASLAPGSGSFPMEGEGPSGAGDSSVPNTAAMDSAAAAVLAQSSATGSSGARLQALQWGEWGPLSSEQGAAATGFSHTQGGRQLAGAAARQLLRIHRMQLEAERLMQAGQPAAAAETLVASLQAGACMPFQVAAAATQAGRRMLQGGAAGVAPVVALGPCHVLRQRLLAALLNACVAAGDRWPLALAAAEALTPCYHAAYPRVRLMGTWLSSCSGDFRGLFGAGLGMVRAVCGWILVAVSRQMRGSIGRSWAYFYGVSILHCQVLPLCSTLAIPDIVAFADIFVRSLPFKPKGSTTL